MQAPTHRLLNGAPQPVLLLLLPPQLCGELGEEVTNDAMHEPAVLAPLQAKRGANPAVKQHLYR